MVGLLASSRKAITGVFDALDRRDLLSFMNRWRDEGVFVYPGDVAESGIFKGKAAIEARFRRLFEQFPSTQFEIQEICLRNPFDLVGTNTAAVHWTGQWVNREGRVGRNSGVTMVKTRRGKLVYARDFLADLGENFRRDWSAAARTGV